MTKTVQTSETRLRAVTIALAIAIMLVPAVVAARAQAQTYKETVLHSFSYNGTDGDIPLAGLIRDAAGNLYGTTVTGGTGNCDYYPFWGCGTVFKVTKTGQETVLYSFTGPPDGQYPDASVVRDAKGNLYGTTPYGGSDACYDGYEYGCGVVYKVDTTGKETVLYTFTGTGGDGGYPRAALVLGPNGTLYGTTYYGGSGACNDGVGLGCGTVFRLVPNGKETVLHSFTGTGGDGSYPQAELLGDPKGDLYGTTEYGGDPTCGNDDSGCGTVFKLDNAGKETVLYTFTWGGDGDYPLAGLVRDAEGNLYGTTAGGGANFWGTVFKLDKGNNETVLYSFCSQGSCADGASPFGGVVRDKEGNLYGTTFRGGASGDGTVFKLSRTGNETVLHSFTGSADGGDGSNPVASLVRDAKGNLYGITQYGGTNNYGTVFELTP
jgi:uncharacterized repeat protein (TIGR03803 family)